MVSEEAYVSSLAHLCHYVVASLGPINIECTGRRFRAFSFCKQILMLLYVIHGIFPQIFWYHFRGKSMQNVKTCSSIFLEAVVKFSVNLAPSTTGFETWNLLHVQHWGKSLQASWAFNTLRSLEVCYNLYRILKWRSVEEVYVNASLLPGCVQTPSYIRSIGRYSGP